MVIRGAHGRNHSSEIGGAQPEVVSLRLCVRTRGLIAEWNLISKCAGMLFPFCLLDLSLLPLVLGELCLFPSPHPPNLLSKSS